jgi:hypothetical protein
MGIHIPITAGAQAGDRDLQAGQPQLKRKPTGTGTD